MGQAENEELKGGRDGDGGASVGGQSRHCERSNRDKKRAVKDTHVVNILRLTTFMVLLVVAAAVSSLVHITMKRGERDAFESRYFSLAHKITDDILKFARMQRMTLHGLSLSYTSHGLETNSSFPFATLPNIEIRGRDVIETAKLISIGIAAVVKDEDRKAWVEYAESNKGWLAEGLAWQEAIKGVEDATSREHLLGLVSSDELAQYASTPHLNPFIFSLNENSMPEVITSPGTLAPFWQMCPALPFSHIINYDLFSQANHRASMQRVIEMKKSIIGGAADFFIDDPAIHGEAILFNFTLDRWKGQKNLGLSYEGGPVSKAYIPIFNKFGSDREVASIMIAYMYWQALLTGSLPDEEEAACLYCVLENSCGQTYTYLVDGSRATYIGEGDLHHREYEEFMVETGFGEIGGRHEGEGTCQYNARVYPSTKLENAFVTWNPVIMTVITVSVFLFTSLLFVTYDRLVQRRHTMVNKRADQSAAVVDSLFPLAVRDRVSSIYAPQDGEPELKLASSRLFDINEDVAYHGETFCEFDSPDDPIADTYDESTVFVSEIMGFSWWSASQPPNKVFTMLEMVYSVFDKLAAKYEVFKVETIAESYVAVTGVPHPQLRHAVIMSSFAHACIVKFEQLLPKLADLFGDEIYDLSFRAGLHSGPVTAGVLRGEKARFQLFGETVNIAATMKHCSEHGRILVSHQTYQLLQDAGKSSWLSPRETKVRSRVHGKLQTYWVKPPVSELGGSGGLPCSDGFGAVEDSACLCPTAQQSTESSHSLAASSKELLDNTAGPSLLKMDDVISELSSSTSQLDNFFSVETPNNKHCYHDLAMASRNLQRSLSTMSSSMGEFSMTDHISEPSTPKPLSRSQSAMLLDQTRLTPNQSDANAACPPKQPRRSQSPEKIGPKPSVVPPPRRLSEELSPPISISEE